MARSDPSIPRVLIFTDVNTDITATLIDETIRLARSRGTFEVCGIATARPEKFRTTPALRLLRSGRRALVAAVAATDGDGHAVRESKRLLDLPRLERDTGIPVLTPPSGDINAPDFLDRVDREIRPDVALSYFCLRIFRPELLRRFRQSVNFHDALLPRRKGLLATSFSVYHGDVEAGYTFHRMTEDIDAGPILVQGSIRVADGEPIAAIRQRQSAAAKAALPRVLDLIASDDPGRPQIGLGNYHSRDEARRMIRIEDPTEVSSEDLRRRLRAFGILHLTIAGSSHPVTRLRGSRRRERLAFTTSDGAVLAPDRLRGLPVHLYRLSRPLYRL